jgi:ribonuclease HIII
MEIEQKALLQIEKFHSKLSSLKFIVSSIERKEFNFEFTVKEAKDNIKVQVYFGKKGIKIVSQGNINSHLYKQVKEVIQDEFELNFRVKVLEEPTEYIGTDECGKGDFFGPLVIAAVYVNKKTLIELKKIGVRDSKELNDSQIHNLSLLIKKIINDNYEIVQINPEKYNQLYNSFKNLNEMLNWAHSKAVDSLLDKVNCDTVITDKFSNNNLNVRSNMKHNSVEFIQEIGAEKYTAVAAASIIARDSFNFWFRSFTQKRFNLPKGSSLIVQEKAKKILNEIGEKEFSKIAKLHFKTFSKIRTK